LEIAMGEYPMAPPTRAAAARFHYRLRAIHRAEGCPTWQRYTYPYRNVVDGQPIEGWGCRAHGLFTTAEKG
jgi:hypothetical protein